ncbi:MAG: hypothetical protein ACI4FZ_00275 [Lachnospiraceae bacterium]
MDTAYFDLCKASVLDRERLGEGGIGTLGEKTVHSVLKQYLSRDISCQEIKVGTFFADVLVDGHIFEIQTRQFNKLRKKLDYFLPQYPVTVVYPMANRNYLRWVSPETGEVSSSRKSPKVGNPLQVFAELYRIRPVLANPNFSLKIVMLDTEEYRMLDGYSRDRKKGATKCDKLPLSLVAEYDIETPADYMMLLPAELPDTFSAKEFAKLAHISLSLAQTTLLLLSELSVVKRIGKDGRSYLYGL